MPLVLLCGLPSSGKSTLAQKLYEHLRNERQCVLLTDEAKLLDRNHIYSDFRLEKELRSELKSDVQRTVSKDVVVILDALNYIKGYRYELYCVSKAIKTTHCVIHCDLPVETCKKWNISRNEEKQYSEEVFTALVQRFEMPDSRNRWDSPLFIIHEGEKLPFQEITDALLTRKAPPPNQSTQSQPLSSTNFLYELDKRTQEVVQAILEAQKTSVIGDLVSVPGTKEKVQLRRNLTLAELTRFRRLFLSYTKMHPVDDTSRIPSMFAQYLNSSI
ncbi:protein KTI12 homolog [Limulus polyphemus]|uniref:Protein KTI12 homolog n=1 Tax=Limulus polyphemus TaxID=6850 RepID=A0ABM1B9I2_LIMPO|nr:protein KTI12 homolog [Limulus polyphemus]